MSATGKDPTASSTPSFVAALIVGLITVGALSAVWLAFHSRKNLHRVFQPRAVLAPEKNRPVEIPPGPIPFWKTVFGTPDDAILAANGPDAYFFVRFIKVFGLYMLVPYFFLTFIILIPVSAAAPTAGLDGLNTMTFGNVALDHQDRHVAHFLVAIILMSWTMFLIWREYNHFIHIRQAWLASPQHIASARTRTIAVTNLPADVTSGSGIKELAETVARLTGTSQPRHSMADGDVPVTEGAEGGVRHVWLSRKAKDLEKIFDERDNECSRLEGGVGKLVALGNKNERKGKTPEKKGKLDTERGGADMVDRFVNPKKRPTWKQGPLGLFGRKMTLETSPVYIKEHNDQLASLREKEDSYELGNTAFVRFGSQQEAHSFARLVDSTDKKYRKIRTGVELVPEDIYWSNVKMSPYQRYIRTVVSWSLTIGLIIIWAVPVAFVGAVSNVDTLCTTAPWLAWICKLPSPVVGIIKGILPPVLLAVLFMLLPIVLRLMIKQQGEIRKSDIELKLFTRFWLFQVIHGFLIVTLSSGLLASLGDLGSTASSVPTLLANNLPSASIFFLTFILSTSFSGAAKTYSRVVPIVMFMLKGILAGNTPRKAFMKEYKMESLMFSTTWPPICLIVCITIVYSVIQPIIVLVALVAFALLFAGYKYTLGWCADQPDSLETGGLYYIKALRTVFVSLYLQGICLAGLLFLSTDQNGARTKSGLGCGAIMIVMIVLVACFQAYIDHFRFKRDFLVYSQSSIHANSSSTKLNSGATDSPDDTGLGAGALGPVSGSNTNAVRAFDHPMFWRKQPVIWVADDPCGIGRFEVDRINGLGVEASTEFAVLDNKGHVIVERGPPDENWDGGYSAP